MARETTTNVLILLALATGCYGYPYFQQKIPNGEMVPHPCKANNLWRGVGHENFQGGGAKNVFGEDFRKNSMVWDRTLCTKDSDGDGKTNGEELGDPDCTWTEGAEPKTRVGLSHPGICDPFDNPRCSGKPEFVDCNALEFKCDAINDPEIVNFTVRIPETAVPPKETTYTCMLFEFPELSRLEHHMVANIPEIDTEDILHHIIVYGCAGANVRQTSENCVLPPDALCCCLPWVVSSVALFKQPIVHLPYVHDYSPAGQKVMNYQGDISHPVDQPFNCRMQADQNCTDMIGLWTVGTSGQCFHPNTGFLIGGNKGYKYGAIEMHWNNPQLRSDYMDSSGMTFYMTPKLRPNNAGTLMIGQQYLQLPPGREAYDVSGGCSSDCTPRVLSGDIQVVAAINHMHYLGSAQITEVRRDGRQVANLAIDRVYNYDAPVMYEYSSVITVRPGDELKTTCVFKTTSRTSTTFWGEGTSQEMCFAFLIYYPKENANFGTCSSFKNIDFCERRDQRTKDGCDFARLRDFSDPAIAGMYANVSMKCQPLLCRDECKEFVRVLKRDNPCYKGDNYDMMKYYSKYNKEMMTFFGSLDSCDLQLYKEDNPPVGDESPETDAGSTLAPVHVVLIALLSITYHLI